MNVIFLMAGGDQHFKEAGYLFPKNLVEIDGLPLIQRVLDAFMLSLPAGSRQYVLLRKEENREFYTGQVVKLLLPGATVIETPDETSGAACTALLAMEYINNDQPLLICNGDIIIRRGLAEAVSRICQTETDGGIVVFEAVHPRWSYVKCNAAGYVVEAAEKRPISKLATAGLYYFAHGADFVTGTMDMIRKEDHVEGRYYLCPVYNQLILRQKKIGTASIDPKDYFSLATPQGVSAYEDFLKTSRYEKKAS